MASDLLYNEEVQFTRFTQGDTKALAFFYDRYYTSLTLFAHKIINDRLQAEDIALECFVKLWQKRTDLGSTGQLRGYLFTVARNACLDYHKHRAVKAGARQALLEQEEEYAGLIESSLIHADLMQFIYEEINALPASYGEIIRLLYLEELSTAQVAAKLGISMDNIRQRKARAVKQLRIELLKKGISRLSFGLFLCIFNN